VTFLRWPHGLHDEGALTRTRRSPGRSVAEITSLGRPRRLSTSGFLADDEDIVSVLGRGQSLVERLGLTHRAAGRTAIVRDELARDRHRRRLGEPLLRRLGRLFPTTGRRSASKALGQKEARSRSLRTDRGCAGSRHLEGVDRKGEETPEESVPLAPEDRFTALVHGLSRIHTGEMEPQYITRYGFYEGHTEYRTDPLAIALIFGLTTIERIEAAFPGKLPHVLTEHCTRDRWGWPAQKVTRRRPSGGRASDPPRGR